MRQSSVLIVCMMGLGCAMSDGARSGSSQRETFHLFLLAGQSNMAGRGTVEAVDRVRHPRVLTLTRDGEWVPAVDPIHFDKPMAGVGLGRSFGIALAEKNKAITIGLIPCAAGGSPIAVWSPGQAWSQTKSQPYDEAIRRTRLAMNEGVLKGILWHQGEGDCTEDRAQIYEEQLHALIARFRRDLGAPQVPFIAGDLGDFYQPAAQEAKAQVHAALASLPQKVKGTGFVAVNGLTCKSDNTHFDAASQRELGRRYARVYLDIARDAESRLMTRP